MELLMTIAQAISAPNAARQRESGNLRGSPRQMINNAQSILRRIPCDAGVKGAEMFECTTGPVDFHFVSPSWARTSATSVVLRPASLSARQDSMA
jgi:hypothetical protein